MAYSTITAILTILPGMPQTTTSQGYSTATHVIEKHLNRASALVDSMIGKRYAVPLTDTCPIIDNITEDITAYYSYRSFYSQDNHNKTEYFEELKELALGYLDRIREGEIDIVDDSGSVLSEKTTSNVTLIDSNTRTYQSFFDVDDELDWKFDSDLLDEVNDNRQD